MLNAEEDVDLVPWMPSGADVSPIENMSGRVIDILTPSFRNRRTTAEELWQAVQEAWAEVSAGKGRLERPSCERFTSATCFNEGRMDKKYFKHLRLTVNFMFVPLLLFGVNITCSLSPPRAPAVLEPLGPGRTGAGVV